MLEASPSSVLSFVSFSCARGERAFKNTATFPAPCLWLHQHIELVPNRPSSKMLLLGPAETPAKLKMTTFTNGKQNRLYQWTDTAYTLQNQASLFYLLPPSNTWCILHIFGKQLKKKTHNILQRNKNCKASIQMMNSFLLRYHSNNENSWPVSRTQGNYSGRQNLKHNSVSKEMSSMHKAEKSNRNKIRQRPCFHNQKISQNFILRHNALFSTYVSLNRRGAPWHANNLYPCFRIRVYFIIVWRGRFLTWVIKNQVLGQGLDQRPPTDNNFKA